MFKTKEKILALFCVVFLVIAMMPVAYGLVESIEHRYDDEIALVTTDDKRDVSSLKSMGVDILETYTNQALVEIDSREKDELVEAGFEINDLPSRTQLSVKSYTFDIKEGEPDIPEDLTVDGYEYGEEGLYLIHMLGPVHPEWRNTLEKKGVDIINYAPYHAYEVTMTPEIAERVEDLYFVDWVGIYHPAYKLHPRLDRGTATVRLRPGFQEKNLMRINSDFDILGSENLREKGYRLILEVDKVERFEDLARMNDVYYISPYTEPELTAEMDAQLLGGGLWFMDDEYDHSGGSQREGDPDIPYRKHGDFGAYINQIGYTGEGVTVAVADTGIGDGTVGDSGHEDFTGRVIGGYSAGEDEENWADGHYHGTACAGLVGGDTHAGTGDTFSFADYYSGQSLAYESELFAMKIFSDDADFMPDELYPIVEIPAQRSDAYVHSNSWGGPGNSEYGERDEIFDQAVRDADRDSSENRPMVITAAAGNDGGSVRGGRHEYSSNEDQIFGDQTINSPASGKNVICVGGNRPYKPFMDYIPEDMYDYSSRGWTVDNRVKPDVIAPSQSVTTQNTPLDGGGYTSASGTSFGNPLVAGAASIVVDWYEQNHGVRPSPAMVKAILINTANELDPGAGNTRGHIPNRDEGWGVPDISKLEYPLDDPISLMFEDQDILLQTGDSVEYHVSYDEPDEPLKFTLTWTDKHAMPGDDSGGSPTLKNNLDLEVETPGGETIYGNAFDRSGDGDSDDGFTYPDAEVMEEFDHNGDGRDNVNNVLNVYIPPEELETGGYTVRIQGTEIPSDANNDGVANQDFSLVKYNAISEGESPSVTVTSPDGGEEWDAGDDEYITWETEEGDDPIDHVSLWYSSNGGGSWQDIESEIDDTGSYTWRVPNDESEECLVRVQAVDTSGRRGEDESDGFFEIIGKPAPLEPGDPEPEDGAIGVDTSPELSVVVEHTDNEPMDVSFYDASDGLIGSESDVASGERSSVEWSDLEHGTDYGWYAVAEDEAGMSETSPTWWFTTMSEDPGLLPPTDPEPEDGATSVELDVELSVLVRHEEGLPWTFRFTTHRTV